MPKPLQWALLGWVCACAFVAAAPVALAPPGAWVEAPHWQLRYLQPDGHTDAGEIDYLAVDRQINVTTEEEYFRVTLRVASERGLQDAGSRSISYDPSYEQIVVHRLEVRRGDEVVDRLPTATFRYLEQEREADRHIYNGRVTALTVLPDIRVGDVIDFAFTRKGRNPVFGGRYFEEVSLGWAQPLQHLRVRVVTHPERPLRIQGRGPAVPAPSEQPAGEFQVTEWVMDEVPAHTYEEATPPWHATYPVVLLTEFASWADVVAWAEPLYAAVHAPPSEELRAAVDPLLQAAATPRERVAALLEFVQREIRYLGMELGESSHQPHPPEVTFSRRFGDCKDKVTVLVQVLRANGFDAFPVLVHSDAGRRLDECLPSPGLFDHVIAAVRLEGRWWWLDPTLAPQRGRLEHRSAPDFGWVLPVLQNGERLERMTVPDEMRRRIVSTETFRSRAWDQPAELEVSTVYSGAAAASVLASLKQRSPAQLTQDYEEYYHHSYPDIRMTGPVTWQQSSLDGSITVTERYEIPDFWRMQEDKRRVFEVYPHLIEGYLPKGVGARRKSPRWVTHPVTVELVQRLELPEPWDLETERTTVEHPAFAFSLQTRGGGSAKLDLIYRYESRDAEVLPEHISGYAERVMKAREHLGFTFTKFGTDSAEAAPWRLNILMVLVAIGTAAATSTALAGWVLWRRHVPPPLPVPGPRGLGGWLILPFLGLFGMILRLALGEAAEMAPSFDQHVWSTLTAVGATPANQALAWQVLYEVIGNTVFVVGDVWLIVLFVKRHRASPALYVLFLTGHALFLLGDNVWSEALGLLEPAERIQAWSQNVGAFIGVAIWWPYFRWSRRVRNTFVR